MSVTNAKNYYTGQGGVERINCAQSILKAYKEKFEIEDELVNSFKAFGGGRAPEGICGALYAVKAILKKIGKDNDKEIEEYFFKEAGALECIKIKGLSNLSCVGCVEKCAEYLEKVEK